MMIKNSRTDYKFPPNNEQTKPTRISNKQAQTVKQNKQTHRASKPKQTQAQFPVHLGGLKRPQMLTQATIILLSALTNFLNEIIITLSRLWYYSVLFSFFVFSLFFICLFFHIRYFLIYLSFSLISSFLLLIKNSD